LGSCKVSAFRRRDSVGWEVKSATLLGRRFEAGFECNRSKFAVVLTTVGKGKEMKVFLICNRQGVGGATLNAALICSEFSNNGIDTKIFFIQERDATFKPQPERQITLHRGTATTAGWAKAFFSFMRYVWREKPDAIIGFTPAANIFAGLSRCVSWSTRCIATQRNPSTEQSAAGALCDKLFGTIGVYKRNIAVSHAVKDSFFSYPVSYRRRISVVHNATPSLAYTEASKYHSRLRYELPEGYLILGCIARLHPQKNIGFAIELLTFMPNAFLLICGGGPEESKLKDMVARLQVGCRVKFVGEVHGVAITEFYRAIDVLLFPSHFEGFGRTLVEALSQGVPIVSNELPVAKEVAGDAAWFAPLEHSQWLAKIEQAVGDNDLQKRVQRSRLYSTEKMVKGYMEAISR